MKNELFRSAQGANRTAYPGGYWEPGKAKYGVSRLDTSLRIPIADGKFLKAAAFFPTDLITGKKIIDKAFPVVVEWTCYTGRPDDFYVKYGYISVMVWMEGTGGSDGDGSRTIYKKISSYLLTNCVWENSNKIQLHRISDCKTGGVM